MVDFRFPVPGEDKRFDGGGDTEHDPFPVDGRFPTPGTDTRFEGGYGVSDFIFTVRTTVANETMTIPCQDASASETPPIPDQNVSTFNAVVQSDTAAEPHLTGAPVTARNDANLVVTFPDAGDHQITISGTFPNIFFNNGGDAVKLISIENLGSVGWQTFEGAFWGCTSLVSVGGTADTSQVTSMRWMWQNCSSMTTTPDTSGWDTSNVTDMRAMWQGCSGLTTPPETGGWDTSEVIYMDSMWRDCSGLTTPPDTSRWNTSNVTGMRFMWYICSSMTTPPDTREWDTFNVTDMRFMWRDCSNMMTAPDTGGWNTSNVTNMSQMWFNCSSMVGIDVSTFNVEKVTDLTSFMSGAAMSTAAYDATLNAWAAQTVNPGLTAHFGTSLRSATGQPGYDILTTPPNNWIITDGGAV